MPTKPLLIANRYQIQDLQSDRLGQGAMGNVYRGVDLVSGESVAVKALKPELVAADPGMVERFNRECQALRQLDHPNIVKMHTAVSENDPASGETTQYLVMEYVKGGSLQDLLDAQPRLPVRRALQIGVELADALARAHHLNIIHRDLKPANVLLAEDGTPRLSDFGVAHFADRPRLTQTGALVGSVGYLSPEVVNLQAPDARADLWAFGVMLFEMLAGEHPFIEEGLTATLVNILKKPTPDLASVRPDLPPALVELITKMLEKDPAQRVSSARLVAARLEELLQNKVQPGFPSAQSAQAEAQSLAGASGTGAGASAARQEPAHPVVLPADSAVRRNQLILLEKVKSFWIRSVLDKCVPQGALLEIKKVEASSAIEHPWGEVLGQAATQEAQADRRKSTLETFYAADRSLLILGEPGSGKTVAMLALARQLIHLAESDPLQPIPVVLNLVSLANRGGDLADWIVEELTAKYQIPRQMGRDWLEENDLLLLLDSLDEIPARLLPEAIRRINSFRETNGLSGLVVCSRTEAYESAGVRLKLRGALRLEPLTREQVEDYLAKTGFSLEELREAFQTDPELGRIAQSPLWLSLLSQTDHGAGSAAREGLEEGESLVDSKVRRQRLLGAYVQRAFQRRRGRSAFEPRETNRWLGWLAGRLQAHNQAVYLLEAMQPGWLEQAGWRLGYMLAAGAVKGLWVGVVAWLLMRAFNAEFAFQEILPGALLFLSFPWMAGLHLLLGGLLWMGYGILFERGGAEQVVEPGWKITWIRGLVSGGAAFGFSWLLLWLAGVNNTLAMFSSMWSGAFFLILAVNLGGSYRDAIRPVEALSFSWREAFRQILAGAGVGTAFTLISLPSFSPLIFPQILPPLFKQWLLNMGPWMLMFFVMGGLRGKRVERRTRVNQGVFLSLRNAAFGGLLSFGVLSGFFLLFGKFYAISQALALQMGVAIGLLVVLMFGGNVIDHYLLRLALWVQGCLPRDLVRFLDYAAELSLLRKVGGGYLFANRLLQEYYAEGSFERLTKSTEH